MSIQTEHELTMTYDEAVYILNALGGIHEEDAQQALLQVSAMMRCARVVRADQLEGQGKSAWHPSYPAGHQVGMIRGADYANVDTEGNEVDPW